MSHSDKVPNVYPWVENIPVLFVLWMSARKHDADEHQFMMIWWFDHMMRSYDIIMMIWSYDERQFQAKRSRPQSSWANTVHRPTGGWCKIWSTTIIAPSFKHHLNAWTWVVIVHQHQHLKKHTTIETIVRILSDSFHVSEMRILRDSAPSPSPICRFLSRRNEQGLHLINSIL